LGKAIPKITSPWPCGLAYFGNAPALGVNPKLTLSTHFQMECSKTKEFFHGGALLILHYTAGY
jgi:hypothetical protein